ncbi:hypothetical protein KKF84_06515, partial [Myxococcota bacterium]|nr:hypothetical protein [Myxococcota bacterium]
MYAYAYLAIIVLFSSCTPYLRVKPLTSHTYKIDRRCTQGPLVFRETIYGARWGEKIVLRVQTRKKADFHVDVVVGSKKRWPLRHHNVPENKWCLAQNGGGKANQDLSGGPAKGIPQPPAGTPAAPAGGFNPGTPGGRDHLTLIPVPRGKAPVQYYGINDFQNGNLRTNSRPGKHLYDTLIVDYKNKSLDPKPIYPKGTPVVITLWSKVPNDFEGAYFEIVHWRYNPNDTPKWIAHLKKQEEKRLRVREKA